MGNTTLNTKEFWNEDMSDFDYEKFHEVHSDLNDDKDFIVNSTQTLSVMERLNLNSVSNFESYQANRLKCRYKDENGKTQLVHTLNGSSLALPRVVAALLEDNQKDGYIEIPEVLRPYTGFDRIG